MIGFHQFLQPSHVGFHVVDYLECRECGRVNSFTGLEIDVLLKQTELKVIYFMNLAGIGRLSFGNHPENGRLARTIPANEAYLFSGVYLERDPAQDLVRSVRFFDIRQTKKHTKRFPATKLKQPKFGDRIVYYKRSSYTVKY